VDNLELTTGLRFAHFEYSGQSYLSPRAGFSYHFSPATSLNFGYGKHFQEPAFNYFANNIEKNRNLKSYHSEQFVLGLEHFFNESFKVSLEIYHKSYADLPVSRKNFEGDSIDFYDNEIVSKQQGETQGLELFFQKKLMKNFHFTLAYSHYVSKYQDFRRNKTGWYTGSYDFRDVFTFIGGYKTDNRNKAWYKNLKSNPWWKYVDWLLSPGDELELSLRFRYSQGRPYTKQYYDPYMRSWYTPYDRKFNTERLPAYHRLDFMLNRRWIFKNSSIVAYFNIMNLYDQKNIWGYVYNNDGTREKIYQYTFTPIGGFTWEF
jgi:outer membrane cobalamin receptor